MKVTEKTVLGKILDLPKGEETLTKHGVPCVSCPMAKLEMDKLKIGQIADMYQLDLDAILKDLN